MLKKNHLIKLKKYEKIEWGVDMLHLYIIILSHIWGSDASSSTCVSVGGEEVGVACIFPWIYEGKSYNGCKVGYKDDPDTVWCSTTVDSEGVYQKINKKTKFGLCSENCPTDPGTMVQQTSECKS